MNPYRLTITLLLSFAALNSLATTFTVTSNADSGPGTFRDALQQAADNGNSVQDQIVFNLPDQSRTGRTIILQSVLPGLSSNLIIDGTTQPGIPFGISGARVIITCTPSLWFFNLFELSGQNNIEIYGLFMQGGYQALYGIHFQNINNMRIGAAGKGNIINGFAVAFYADAGSKNISIQGNIIGEDETGTYIDYTTVGQTAFDMLDIINLQIGGLGAGEGNLITVLSHDMSYSCSSPTDYGYLNIQGNTIGTDISGINRLAPNDQGFMISGYSNSGDPFSSSSLSVEIINNLSVAGFILSNIPNPFRIQGNHLGVGADNLTNIVSGSNGAGQYMLGIGNCPNGLIGGPDPADKNYIYNAVQWGLSISNSGGITISKNSFACNGIGISLNWQLPRQQPFVNITSQTASSIGGNSLPNAIIELFYDDECPGCEGKKYIGSTTADNNGNWTYTLTAPGAVVATATDTYGATSQFSTATLNTVNVTVQNATCGRKNGSIKGIQVSSGTDWHWEDDAGNIIGTDVDLVNVAAGNYTLVASIGGNFCKTSSSVYTVQNIGLPVFNPADISITPPSCGLNNGVIQYSGSFDGGSKYEWLNATGVVVSPDFSSANPLTGLGPGSYTLQLSLNQDPTCQAQYGPFNLVNRTGPSLKTDLLQITPSTCGSSNGSLTNITYQNAVGGIYIGWEDNAHNVVGHSLDLVNVPAGSYRLVFKDGAGCDTLFTPYYQIPDEGSITYNTDLMTIKPSSCKGSDDAAITGITSVNANTFNWYNTATASVVGNGEDLLGVGGGTYQLLLSNVLGCKALISGLVIPDHDLPAFDYSRFQIFNDTCNSKQGAIVGLNMKDASRTYTWAWYGGTPVGSQPVGSPLSGNANALSDLAAGDYYVLVTDQYGCPVISNTFPIEDIELAPDAPLVSDQYIPRNSSATISVQNAQKGTYDLLDKDSYNAVILASSASGVLQTPPVSADEVLYVRFSRGDCVSGYSPVNIKVFDSVKLYVPNAFTPNGDGVNDSWHVIAHGLVNSIHILVFDRWGTEVYSSNSLNTSWDGTFHNQRLAGTFVYLIVGRDYYNRPIKLNGTLLIIR